MVLGSQSPREGMGRQFMASRGRGRRNRTLGRLVIGAAVLLLLVLGAWWLFSGEEGTEAAASNGSAGAGGRQQQTAGGGGQSTGGGSSVAQASPNGGSELATGARGGSDDRDAGDQAGRPDRSEADSSDDTTSGDEPAPTERLDLSPASGQGETASGNSTTSGGGASGGETSGTAGLTENIASEGPASERIARGMSLIDQGQLVRGRRVLSEVLLAGKRPPGPDAADVIRRTLDRVNEDLLFSPSVNPEDPLVETYKVQSGDRLIRIGRKYDVPYQVLERVNGIEARKLRAGQTIKLIKGPFHARIHKQRFIMDLYLRDPEGRAIYARSFSVGLGEGNSTPAGQWVVGRAKTTNPDWRNPRTGEYYKPDDEDNPIGEYWISLKGVGPKTEGKDGYGIHGTIEPDSIGRQMSMGCIRLRRDDIKQLFHMLVREDSTVQIIE